MPKKTTKEKHDKKKHKFRDDKYHSKHSKKHNSETSLIDIGKTNVKRWKLLKFKCSCQTDTDFVVYLLNLLEENFWKICQNNKLDLDNGPKSPEKCEPNTDETPPKKQTIIKFHHTPENDTKITSHQSTERSSHKKKYVPEPTLPISILIEQALQEPSTAPKVCPLEEIPRSMFPEILTNDTLTNNQTPTDTPIRNFDLNTSIPASEKLLPLPVPIIKSPIWNSCKPEAKIPVSGIVKPVEASSDVDTCDPCEKQDSSLSGNNSESNVGEELEDASGVSRKKIKRKEHDAKHARKKLKHHDIRKAPQLEFTVQPHTAQNGAGETNSVDTDGEGVRVKIKLCYSCDTRHLQDACPLQRPVAIISDQLSLSEWKTKKPIKVEEVTLDGGESEERMLTYAEASVPEDCYLQEVEEGHGLSVFAKVDIAKYAQFGPLVGPRIKEVDIPDDFNMKHIWELRAGEHQSYINTEDAGLSNWVRFIRPAQSREKRNVTAITRNKTLYLISNERIEAGDEIRYWTDDVTNSGKRRMEKTNCGGCNLSFAHALYYRTHCSVFHDARYSLTIRKYHCKVCGQAVLGKDNIVRHAAELHNGQGAYQCQFCKKFFLRLNYLEMHRTYGCAANPHRSRPLCDFCGRKFCQPQKLKVHIKRMHSDISLSEFQCPLCLKLLGSRAAVQRHAREVHRGSAISGAISPAPTGNTTLSTSALSCSRCGKLFQNKSNLKIHMLTHSGVKPFKCKEDNCNAAFTTKQCLQFHYKKVHGFAEDVMPTIERSVEYTFAAYSGGAARDEDIIVATPNSAPSPKLIEDISIGETVKETSPEQNATVDINIRGDSPPIALECEKQPYLSGPPLLSKGSKKWLGDVSNHAPNNDLYSFEDDPQQNTDDASSIILDVDESQPENNTDNKFSMCLNVYNPRHDSSNASLLVEAALDSVSDIQINTESNQNCSDSLVVSNLYPLSHQDGYLQNDLTTERGDVSVTDYDGLQHDEFSAPSSPTLPSHLIHEYVVRHDEPRQRNEYHLVDRSPTATHSPPRYDFNQSLNTENISNDSDGIVAQNLTVHAKDKDRLDHQLDFSSYKTHYNDVDSSDLSLRKYDSIRSKFDIQTDDRDNYNITIDVTDGRKSYDGVNGDLRKQFISDGGLNNDQYSDVMDTSDLKNVTSDIEMRNKTYDSLDSDALRALKYDLESKYEIEIRNKGYDILEADDLRNKVIYDATIENDLRQNKSYNLVEADFRSDRSFEPLILNPTELQGLDMSARGYHGFHSSSAVSRYHHMYGEPDRETGVGGYGPPTDVLRVVSLDLTSQGRHGGLHSLHSHHGLLTDHSRLTLDQTRLISSEHNLSVALLGSEGRLLSDHTTNRILSTDGLSDARLVPSPDTHRMLSETARLPGRGFSSYPMSPAAYHPPPLSARSHIGSPSHNPPSYHHYSGYY